MSNDVTTIDFTKNKVAAKFAHLNPTDDNLADGLSSSYGVIGIKGKTWTLKKGGDKKYFGTTDPTTKEFVPAHYIDAVILRQAHGKSRAYYVDFQEGQSEGKRPICASLHGVVPDTDVEEQQSETCGLCPRNKRVLNPETGKQSTECRENKRLALLLLPAQTKNMFGQPLVEPVFLRVPAASLSNLAKFGDHMSAQGCHFSTFITRISFDPTKAYQSMVFRAVQMLTDAEADTVLNMREDPLAKRITGEDEEERALPAPRGTQTVIPPQAAPAPAPQAAPATIVQEPSQAPVPQKPLTTGFNEVIDFASPSTLTIIPDGPPPQVTETAPLSAAPAAFQAAPAPPADTGPATAATAELDAQIAALMPNKAG